MSDLITNNHADDNIDRRGFLRCMAWAGTGIVWTITGGVPSSKLLGAETKPSKDDFQFVQISDSHIGFNKPANPDVTGTMKAAIDKINAHPGQPDFLIHTGDLTHQSKPQEFDDMDQVLKSARTKDIFYVPGEHDTSVDDGKAYLERYGKGGTALTTRAYTSWAL
jgi:3',5'-cyclic-AMP phosphodiesterase